VHKVVKTIAEPTPAVIVDVAFGMLTKLLFGGTNFDGSPTGGTLDSCIWTVPTAVVSPKTGVKLALITSPTNTGGPVCVTVSTALIIFTGTFLI
jgi:hypothetical protein